MGRNRLEDLLDEIGAKPKREKSPYMSYLAKIGNNVVVISEIGTVFRVEFVMNFKLDNLLFENFEELRNWVKETNGTTN
jgi:hypothetical protein